MVSLFYRRLYALCVCLTFGSFSVKGAYVCPDGWILEGNKCYYFSTDIVTWDAANDACQSRSAELVEINDEAENNFLLGVASTRSDSYFWIGLTDINEEGTFAWNSGSALSYTNWTGSGPDNSDEDCVHLYWRVGVSGWNDNSCQSNSSNICERDVRSIYFWIGLSDKITEGNFLWNSGTALTFTNWTGDNPDDTGNEDCVNINWHNNTSGWTDDTCQSSNFYICAKNAQDTDECDDGFSGDGTTCTDINECKDGSNNCAAQADCKNTAGSFTCTCKWGYSGDGTTCAPQILYRCNPDGSLNLYNLPEDSYIFAMQDVSEGDDKRCTILDTNATSVLITGCSKDLPILVTYGSFVGVGSHLVQGGPSLVVVNVRCREISADGAIHTVNNTYRATLVIDEEVVLNPAYEVTSSLGTTTATVGNPVIWTIHYPDEYILEVSSCTAYPGTDDSSSLQITLVSEGGCPVSSQLISEFIHNANGTSMAVIQAFKFYGYDYVYLTCTLKVCPQGITDCVTTCGRKKRSVQEGAAREPRGAFPASITNILRVIDPNATGSVAGVSVTPMLITALLLALLVLDT